jgi:hypothetical protein
MPKQQRVYAAHHELPPCGFKNPSIRYFAGCSGYIRRGTGVPNCDFTFFVVVVKKGDGNSLAVYIFLCIAEEYII